MKCIAIVHQDLRKLCLTEFQELVNVRGKNIPTKGATSGVEIDLSPEKIKKMLHHSQSLRCLALLLGRSTTLKDLHLQPSWKDVSWKDFFQKGLTFKVDVLNVKGQENRFDIAKAVSAIIFEEAKEFSLSIDFKKPDVTIIVYFTSKEYVIGLDLAGQELHKRDYRVFAHSASFTGDIAYDIVRRSGFKSTETILLGMAKDGALPIEAALFANRFVVRKGPFSFEKIPLFSKASCSLEQSLPPSEKKKRIFAFDPSRNIMSARKNMVLAGVENSVELNKYALDELDVRYNQGFFDVWIIHLTAKDERNINEAYYQAKYILRNKGRLLLIAREQFSLSLSDSFTLLSEDRLVRGESILKLWLLEKK